MAEKDNNFVKYKNKEFYVENNILIISDESIEDISEIIGLNKLVNLKILDLSYNLITEIKGLNMLTKLEKLYLNDNKINRIKGLDNLKNLKVLRLGHNYIKKIEGLSNLEDLKVLELEGNKISQDLINELGGTIPYPSSDNSFEFFTVRDPQKFVDHSKELKKN